jgi:hypothetical protein
MRKNTTTLGSFGVMVRDIQFEGQGFVPRPAISWALCLTTSTSYTSNNRPRMKNQRLPVQFSAPDDGRYVARNMLSFT